MLPLRWARISPRIALGVFVCLLLLACNGAYAAQGDTKANSVGSLSDNNLVELFSEEGFKLKDKYDLEAREDIARKIIVKAQHYGFDAGLLTAIFRYEDEVQRAAKRLDQFHLESGLTMSDDQLKPVWEDLDNALFTLNWIKEKFPNSRENQVAYYLLGDRYYPPNGYDDLTPEMKEIIDNIFADADRFQKRITAPRGPSVIEVKDNVGDVSNYGWGDNTSIDERERQKAYVDAMRYFNPYLDEETANEIYIAIKTHWNSYQDIDARFVMAIVACESSFNPDAVSRCGAMGLGQLMPFTAKKHGVADPFDISENIRATYEYLETEFERWAGRDNIYDFVLAAYNAGPGAVEKYDGIPPYDETINYVYKVTQVYKNFLRPEEYKDRIYGKSKHYPKEPPR